MRSWRIRRESPHQGGIIICCYEWDSVWNVLITHQFGSIQLIQPTPRYTVIMISKISEISFPPPDANSSWFHQIRSAAWDVIRIRNVHAYISFARTELAILRGDFPLCPTLGAPNPTAKSCQVAGAISAHRRWNMNVWRRPTNSPSEWSCAPPFRHSNQSELLSASRQFAKFWPQIDLVSHLSTKSAILSAVLESWWFCYHRNGWV